MIKPYGIGFFRGTADAGNDVHQMAELRRLSGIAARLRAERGPALSLPRSPAGKVGSDYLQPNVAISGGINAMHEDRRARRRVSNVPMENGGALAVPQHAPACRC